MMCSHVFSFADFFSQGAFTLEKNSKLLQLQIWFQFLITGTLSIFSNMFTLESFG